MGGLLTIGGSGELLPDHRSPVGASPARHEIDHDDLIEPALEILRVLEEIGVRPCGLGDGEVSARRVCRAGAAAADSVRVRLSRRVGACHLGVVRREHALF